MKKIMLCLLLILFTSQANAALTVNNVPRAKTGGATPTLQDSAISQQGSNIGIGSTGPRQVLEIVGNGLISGNVGIGTINVTGQSGVLNVMGNVGIGTWAPGRSLDVVGGNVIVSNAGNVGTSVQISNSNTGTSTANTFQITGYTATDGTGRPRVQVFSQTAGAAAGVKNLQNTGNVSGFATESDSYTIFTNNGPGGLQFGENGHADMLLSYPNGGLSIGQNSYYSRVAPGNGLLVEGNVGIGTFLNLNNLSVSGNAAIGTGSYSGIAAPSNGLIISGNVGIGTISPGAMKLDVFGSIRQTGAQNCSTGTTTDSTGTFNGCVASDIKLKTSIDSLLYKPELINKLNPVTYRWDDNRDQMIHSGFIAQEVEKVMPSAVVPAGKNYKGIDSNALLSAVVKELQEQGKRIEKLEKKGK